YIFDNLILFYFYSCSTLFRSVFSESVLSVGMTTAHGGPVDESLRGPWVTVAAPGTSIESLGPGRPGLINGVGTPGKLGPDGGASVRKITCLNSSHVKISYAVF